MKCPKCGHVFKDPMKVLGGKKSRRSLDPETARKMAEKSVAARRKNKSRKKEKKT